MEIKLLVALLGVAAAAIAATATVTQVVLPRLLDRRKDERTEDQKDTELRIAARNAESQSDSVLLDQLRWLETRVKELGQRADVAEALLKQQPVQYESVLAEQKARYELQLTDERARHLGEQAQMQGQIDTMYKQLARLLVWREQVEAVLRANNIAGPAAL